MQKKYIVRLSEEERLACQSIVKKLTGSSQKVRRAQILLKSDADGPSWADAKIAEAFNCRTQTIENLRKRVVTDSFDLALNGKKRDKPPTVPKLDGQGEAKLIAMRLGKPPKGFGKWTLSLLADQLVKLEVVDSICPETVRQSLKKSHEHQTHDRLLGHSPGEQCGVCRLHGRSAGNLRKTVRSSPSRDLHG